METLEQITQRLQTQLTQYRKIWVQGHSRHGQRDVLVTLFTQNGYRMIPLRSLSSISYEDIFTRLQREISEIDSQ